MTAFIPSAVEFSGRFTVAAPIDAAFELFSPEGERAWVPEWDPELLDPSRGWARGQIFRTHEERGDAVWVVTDLNRAAHQVEYHRVESNRYVARVRVGCTAAAGGTIEVVVSYRFVGLSDVGNGDIAAMTGEAYAARMSRWKRWIDDAQEALGAGRK